MADLIFPLEQLNRLRRIMDADCHELTRTQRKQARIVEALLAGVPGVVIASREGGGRSNVSNVKKKLTQEGLNPFLLKWEADIARNRKNADRIHGKPGPVGIDSIDKWVETQKAHNGAVDEPVFEIANLLIGPGANIAIFIVRDRKAPPPDGPANGTSFLAQVRAMLKEPNIPDLYWSRLSVFDANISRTLSHLSEKHAELESSEIKLNWRDKFPNPFPELRQRFGTEFEFFIFTQGGAAARNLERWSKTKQFSENVPAPNILRLQASSDFFKRLASVIYRLRERWSCAGLLPTHWLLMGAVENWVERDDLRPFFYQCDVNEFQRALRHYSLLWYYTAFHGGLFHMNRLMWSRLPWHEEFTLPTAPVRISLVVNPKVKDLEEVTIGLRILPNIGYEFFLRPLVPVKVERNKLIREFRDRLQKTKGAARFCYSTKTQSFVGWEVLLNPDKADQVPPEDYDQIPAVLIPRHFVMGDPQHSLQEISKLATRVKKVGAFRENVAISGSTESALLFHAPELLAGIRQAFAQNTYGDQLFVLRINLTRLKNNLGGTDESGLWKSISFLPLTSERPSYWWLNPAKNCHRGPNQWRWNALKMFQKEAVEQGRTFHFMPPFNDTLNDGFRELLRDCDADFLLRGLSSEDRTKLNHLTDDWGSLLREIIGPLYDVDDRDGKGRVIAATHPDLRKQAAARKDELKSWVYDALEAFSHNDQRVLRKAIEVAQRCSLAGLEPVALVVETESSLLRRWVGFLRQKLMAALMPRGATQKARFKETGQNDVTASQERDIRELSELLLKLLRTPQDVQSARNFGTAWADADFDCRREVLSSLVEEPDGKRLAMHVMNVTSAFKTKSGIAAFSDAEVLAQCEPIWKTARETARKGERQNGGG